MKSFMNVDDESNLTGLSPIITCLRTLNESEALWQGEKSKCFKELSFKQLKDDVGISSEDGFCFVVSLQDGSALYISSSIANHLGYPKDMLVGQCIMNFLYQKDHITFANHLTQGLNACFNQEKGDDSHLVINAFFCRLRLYHGLKYGYSVSEKKTQYKPFKVTLHINDLIFDDICVEKSSSTLCVKATATPVASVYSVPEEIPAMTSFSTRHTASCHFSHVDASAIPYLGYLPQDMVGYSVFDFYHVDDMPQLKDIYELVVKEQGTSFRSKPYRFKVQNGCFIMLETEWSCFINPWSRKLEFVVRQHRVLKGPIDVNIFTPIEIEENTIPDEILKESFNIQTEIKTLLSQSIKNIGADRSKKICNKRKRDLASFVYNCIDEEYGYNKLNHTQMQNMIEGESNSDLDSVVMGDISPYREIKDSSVCSETPTNVQQICYEENIERFFASQPKTFSTGSDEWNKSEKLSNRESQGSSAGTSGNASKDRQSSPVESPANSGNNKAQEYGSNSSKCNNSSITTGDSGYGKSTEKNQASNPNTSQASTCSQTWNDNIHMEKISACLALTEESLSAHNRMNHKFSKHRKNKSSINHTTTFNDCSGLQQTESLPTPHKKKYLRSFNPMFSTPTQTDEVKVSPMEQPKFNFVQPQPVVNPGLTTMASMPQTIPTSSLGAYSAHPYLFASASAAATIPTPFFIPVVYMGSMPYYPPISTMFPQAGNPFWPGVPIPSNIPTTTQTATANSFQIPNSNSNLGAALKVPSSGVTAASLVATTTTMIASGTSVLKDCKELVNASGLKTQLNSVCATIGSKDQIDIETNDSYLLMDDSELSIQTGSGSSHGLERTEDMDLDTDCISKDPLYQPYKNKLELTSEIALRYEMTLPDIEEVLKKDLKFLKSIPQPDLVNKQLKMLQKEYEEENRLNVVSEDLCMMDSEMLGLTPENEAKKGLDQQEECLLQLIPGHA